MQGACGLRAAGRRRADRAKLALGRPDVQRVIEKQFFQGRVGYKLLSQATNQVVTRGSPQPNRFAVWSEAEGDVSLV